MCRSKHVSVNLMCAVTQFRHFCIINNYLDFNHREKEMQDSHWIISPTVREDMNATNFNSTSILCHHFYFCKNSGAGSEVLFFTMLSCKGRHGENSWGRVVQWSALSPRIKKIVGLNRAASCALLCLHVLLVSTWFFVVMQRSSHGTKTSKGIAILN